MNSKELLLRIEQYLKETHAQAAVAELNNSLLIKYHVKNLVTQPEPVAFTIPTSGAPFWGSDKAKVVVVEYSDFECPYCKKMQPAIRRLRQDYSKQIQWVFKSYPLPFHKSAKKAHIAARCAHSQGKYFDFQYRVFDSSPQLDEQTLLQIASDIGLDKEKFSTCVADKDNQISTLIDSELAEGSNFGVNGTPTIFINNRPISGYMEYQQLKKEIDKAISPR